MRLKSEYKHPRGMNFIIQQEDLHNVTDDIFMREFCLYVYEVPELFYEDSEADDCTNFQDKYCQDELEISQRQAFEKFGVPLDSWVRMD